MKIVFLGTPEFACPSLLALKKNGFDVAAVFTQPDKPKNRGHKLTPPPVKVLAQDLMIPVYQYEKIKSDEAINTLKQLNPDLIITCAFGQLLSRENLDIPPLGTINVHASLLPKYRGPAPIEWCIINGETKTGITTMLTDIGLDTGDMLLCEETEINETDTAGELSERLSFLGAEVLIRTLNILKENKSKAIPQDEGQSSYFPMLDKEFGKINFEDTSKDIINKVRGLNGSHICAYAQHGGEKIRIYEACAVEKQAYAKNGEVVCADIKNGLVVKCSDGLLRLKKLQMPGKKPLRDIELLNGKTINTGEMFE